MEWKLSDHFRQGGAVHDTQLARLELDVVDCHIAGHGGTLLCNDRELEKINGFSGRDLWEEKVMPMM